MDLILLPKSTGTGLRDIYHRALQSSVELYIVSAYLTHWEIDESLGDQCKSFLFIVGKDFGITRKAACEKVIKWLPKNRQVQFLAAESIDGFHPKSMFWRESNGKCYALVGSSNLSRAAFSTNHEVNGYSQITSVAFEGVKTWLSSIERSCVAINKKWLANYREAVQRRKPVSPKNNEKDDYVFKLALPSVNELNGLNDVLLRRRKQMKLFKQVKPMLEELFRGASRSRNWSDERNLGFYKELNNCWFYGDDGSRFQSYGWERQGKGSNFKEFSKSLVSVLDAEEIARDQVVVHEIDRMGALKVTTRGALFSEMLCQFFPERYFVIDQPVIDWLKGTKVSAPRGTSEGGRYIHSARLLRAALDRVDSYPAKNLAELDAVIRLAGTENEY
jgi:hypothetical protein